MRAWATAGGVQRPLPSGTIPSLTHRRSVAGDTSSLRATSLSVRSGMTPRMKAAGPRSWSRRLRAMRPAASAGGVRPKATPCGCPCGPPLPDLLPGPGAARNSAGFRGCQTMRPEPGPLGGEVRVLLFHEVPVTTIDRLGDRDQAERRLDVPARFDPPAGESHRDVLLALEVPVGDLRGHLHLDLRLPVDVVGPLPVQVAVLARLGCPDVHDEVDVRELEPLRDVGVAQLRAHLRVLAHRGEDPVHDGPELLRR